MIKTIYYIVPLLLLSCSKERNNETSSASNLDSVNRINEKIRRFQNLWATVEFDSVSSDGYILPANEVNIYLEDDSTTLINVIQIDSIQPIHISGISRKKMPEMLNDDYCKWANLIRGHFKDEEKAAFFGQTKIISGKFAYEILKKHKVLWKKDTIEILEASNFDMESADEDGITGCDNFRILLIKSGESRINLVAWDDERKLKNDHRYARLYNSDGVGDEVTKVESISDTINIQIYSSFQEGYGTSTLKIFASEKGFAGNLKVLSRKY